MRCIAYIPARAGSKGIPHKNIRPLCGKPLIAYAIEAEEGRRGKRQNAVRKGGGK